MNTLLLNRDGFQMPADGWYQVAPLGEFAHAAAGVVQVVDVDACAAMVNRFNEEAGRQPFDKLRADRFAGLLVDFDHFSLDDEKRSEAAGWITSLENRDGGLFAQIRWSDLGEEAVKGGRYRFLSPVWNRADCVDLGGGRVRPVRLLNAAVTNDPNLKGMRPLSNSGRNAECGARNAESGDGSHGVTEGTEVEKIANAAAARFKWVLGANGDHCPSCTAMAGQVHTMAEWDAAGVRPGGAGLYCRGKCKCRLESTDAASGGAVVVGPVRRRRPVRNAVERLGGSTVHGSGGREGEGSHGGTEDAEVGMAVREELRGLRMNTVENTMIANTGWTDAARAASLAVRRAKAALRAAQGLAARVGGTSAGGRSGGGAGGTSGGRTGGGAGEGRQGRRPPSRVRAGAGESGRATGPGSDYLGEFEEEGFEGMSPESVAGLTEQIRAKLQSRKALEPAEYGFLEHLADQEFGGTSDGDPVFRWIERQHDWETEVGKATGMNARAARTRFTEIEEKQKGGRPVTSDDQAFLRKYQQGVDSWKAGETGARSKEKVSFGRRLLLDLFGYGPDIGKPKERMGNAERGMRSGEVNSEQSAVNSLMANKGWTDEARAAALAVRQAKAAARKRTEDGKRKTEGGPPAGGKAATPVVINPKAGKAPEVDGGIYLGGSRYFDERTGRYVYPPEKPKVPGKPKKGEPVPIKPPYRLLGGAAR